MSLVEGFSLVFLFVTLPHTHTIHFLNLLEFTVISYTRRTHMSHLSRIYLLIFYSALKSSLPFFMFVLFSNIMLHLFIKKKNKYYFTSNFTIKLCQSLLLIPLAKKKTQEIFSIFLYPSHHKNDRIYYLPFIYEHVFYICEVAMGGKWRCGC